MCFFVLTNIFYKTFIYIVFEPIVRNPCIRNIGLKLVVHHGEVLENGMCDVIKIHPKRRDILRSGKVNQPINIKTAL